MAGSLAVSPPRVARLAARLTIGNGRFVRVDQLVDTLWDDTNLPKRPDRAIHDMVADLRTLLTRAGLSGRLETDPNAKAYRLALQPDELDSACVATLLEAGRDAMAHSPANAIDLFRTALAMFAGEPYEQFADEPFALHERARLMTLQGDLVECLLLTQAEVDPAQFLSEAAGWCRQYPERARPWYRWMFELARAGRQREALNIFQELRSRLADLGLTPAAEIVELDRRIAANEQADGDGPSRRQSPAGISKPSIFVGRRAELEALELAWQHVQRGEAMAGTLLGEEGIGKTSLVGAFIESVLAREQRTAVVVGRCDPDPTSPFQPISEALRQLTQSLADEERELLLRGREAVASLIEPRHVGTQLEVVEDVVLARQRLFREVAELVTAVARLGPLILVVEDVHWADRNTVDLLRSLLRSLDHQPVLMLLTARDDEIDDIHPTRGLLGDLARRPTPLMVDLEGIDTAAVNVLIDAIWPEFSASNALAGPIRASTEGNPLFITEVLRELMAEKPHDRLARFERQDVPRGVRDITARRIAELGAHARAVLGIASVIGTEFAVPTLLDLDEGRDRRALLAAIDEGTRAGVLSANGDGSDVAFRHRFFRDVTYQMLSGPRRADAHYRVAESLRRRGATARVIAHHLLAAGDLGDTGQAFATVIEAAAESVSRLDAGDAVALIRRALVLAGTHGDRQVQGDLLIALGRALMLSGNYLDAKEAALAAWDVAAERGDDEALVDAACEHGRFGSGTSDDRASIDLLERTIARVSEARLIARAMARLAYHIGAFGADDGDRGETIARQALDLAHHSGDELAIGKALWALGIATLGRPNDAERIELADRLLELGARVNDPMLVANSWRLRSLASFAIGDIVGFDAATAELSTLATRLGSWIYGCDVDRWRAMRALATGSWTTAFEHIERHGRLGEEKFAFTISYIGQRILAALVTGQHDDARSLIHGALTQAPDDFETIHAASALVDARTGRLDAARGTLDNLLEAGPGGWRKYGGTLPATLALTIETAAILRRPVPELELELRPYLGKFLVCSWGEASFGAAARYVALCRAVEGDHEAAAIHFQDAVSSEHQAGLPVFVASSLRWWATSAAWNGDIEEAQQLCSRAKGVADRVGSALLSDECARLARSLESAHRDHAPIPGLNVTSR